MNPTAQRGMCMDRCCQGSKVTRYAVGRRHVYTHAHTQAANMLLEERTIHNPVRMELQTAKIFLMLACLKGICHPLRTMECVNLWRTLLKAGL